jgi:hypothetical protein
MAAKLTRLTHRIAIQLHLAAESYTICNSRSRRPVRKLLDTPSYINCWSMILYLWVFYVINYNIYWCSFKTLKPVKLQIRFWYLRVGDYVMPVWITHNTDGTSSKSILVITERWGGGCERPSHVITIRDRRQIAWDRLVTILGGSTYIIYSQEKKKKNNNARDILRVGTWQVALFFFIPCDVHLTLSVICEGLSKEK